MNGHSFQMIEKKKSISQVSIDQESPSIDRVRQKPIDLWANEAVPSSVTWACNPSGGIKLSGRD